MVMHDISAHFIVRPETGLLVNKEFRNFAVTPEGHIVIKNYSAHFRDKLLAVLGDDSIPFAEWPRLRTGCANSDVNHYHVRND